MNYIKIKQCRICKSKKIKEVFNLGKQVIATYFPKKKRKGLPKNSFGISQV